MNAYPKLVLRKKRAEVLDAYAHPWIFSNGLMEKPPLEPGTQVQVVGQDGRPRGYAFYHPHNPIALRMLRFEDRPMDEAAWRARILAAQTRRRELLPDSANYRLIHGENDGFPGLTVDRYGPLLCLQNNSAGFEHFKVELASWLAEVTGAQAVYELGDSHARRQEGLPASHGFLYGHLDFPLAIEDDGFALAIDPSQDQKTGHYLDQRPARAWLEGFARDRQILDLCCYTGGFTLPALRGGAASVLALDSSVRALETLGANVAANGLDATRCTTLKADVFTWLKQTPERLYDLVVLDPPSLAKSVQAEERARKGYRQLNRAAAAWVRPGGYLLTFSCTGVVATEVFNRSVFLGLRDAGREGLVLKRFGPGPDHPELLTFPEGIYLKGLLLQLP